MNHVRIIFHIDMNCYYVACELINNPQLLNEPIAVASKGASYKGIILTSSYPARKYGIYSGMPTSEALKLYPKVILLEPHYELYNKYHQKFVEYFKTITPILEVASVDEAYLDVTDVCKKIHPEALAKRIQDYIYNTLHLPCSIGIGPNKLLAKIGSDYKKPLGITVLRKREVKQKLWPLPISSMMGVGKKTLKELEFLKIKTIEDFVKYQDVEVLKAIISNLTYDFLINQAMGNGDDFVNPNSHDTYLSMSHSETFENELFDKRVMEEELLRISKIISDRLIKQKVLGQTITLQIKYNTFKNITRSKTIIEPVNDYNVIYNVIKELFDDSYDDVTPVRLFGISVSKLTDIDKTIKQMSIYDNFDDIDKSVSIDKLINTINKDIGRNILVKGCNSISKK